MTGLLPVMIIFAERPDVTDSPKRRQIIEGAALVFNKSGYDGASMSRIADEAGVSKGTLYNYFDSKSALFAAFVERDSRETIAWVLQPADPEPSLEIFLAEVARRLIQTFLSRQFQTLHRIVVSEAAKFPHLAQIYLESGYMRGCREFASWLDVQAHRGRIEIDDPVLAAEQFGALCRTRLWVHRCLEVQFEPSAREIEVIAEASVAMFLNTYRPTGAPI